MDVGDRVTQEQLPKILTTRVARSLDCARDDKLKGVAYYLLLMFFCVYSRSFADQIAFEFTSPLEHKQIFIS